jgi:K+-transporting ATPase KdpF subunit
MLYLAAVVSAFLFGYLLTALVRPEIFEGEAYDHVDPSDLMLVVTTLLAIPLSRYLAWIMNGQYRAPALRWLGPFR